MRSKKAILNIVTSLMLQGINIISGLIVPSMIIKNYGSDVNGLIVSIMQFLNYISLADGGAGGIIKAALYKPLADNDKDKTGRILLATRQFFNKIGVLFISYVLILCVFYPDMVQSGFSENFIVSLICILAANTLIRYMFGITNQLLIQADQKSYITQLLQCLVIVLNMVVTVLLIEFNATIQVVKLYSIVAYLVAPVIQNIYVKKTYNLPKVLCPDNDALKQRWDGFGQHIAYFIHTNTDVVLLTVFSTVSEVSVYSVYNLIASGLRNIIFSISNGFSAAIGNMLAKEEESALRITFEILEWMNFVITFAFFSTANVMILPFVGIYTNNVNDISYIRGTFANILLLSEMIYCIRFPMVVTTNAAGHFKQTKKGAFIEAFINIFISLCLVKKWGLIGVGIGTVMGMLYRTIDYVFYLKNNIVCRRPMLFVKEVLVNGIASLSAVAVIKSIKMPNPINYMEWTFQAIIAFAIISLFLLGYNLLFYRNTTKTVIRKMMRMLRK